MSPPPVRPSRSTTNTSPDYAGHSQKRSGSIGNSNSSGENQRRAAAAADTAHNKAKTTNANKKKRRCAALDVAHKQTKSKDKKLKSRNAARRAAQAEADAIAAAQRVQHTVLN